MKIVRFSPTPKDFYELQKLIPDSWKHKIKTGYSQAEEYNVKIKHRLLCGKWIVAEVNTLHCKDFYNTIYFRTLIPMYKNRKYLQWQENNPNKHFEIRWNTLF